MGVTVLVVGDAAGVVLVVGDVTGSGAGPDPQPKVITTMAATAHRCIVHRAIGAP